MSKKQTLLEKAIADIDAEMHILQLTRERLLTAQARAPKRKAKPKTPKAPTEREL
jgi:hypothetical protein